MLRRFKRERNYIWLGVGVINVFIDELSLKVRWGMVSVLRGGYGRMVEESA